MVLLSLGFPLAVCGAGLALLGPATALKAAAATTALAAAALLVARLLVRRAVGPVVPNTIAFFHPAAAGGGGGERVLWAAIAAVQAAWPGAEVWVYVDADAGGGGGGAPPSAAGLAGAAAAAFGLAPPRPVVPVPLPGAAAALDPAAHPRLTLVTQSLAGGRAGAAGLAAGGRGGRGGRGGPPALWVDTAGWAAAYPVAAAAGCAVAAYVHYPLVSTDMLARLAPARGGEGGRGGAGAAALRWGRALAKAGYYYGVAALYGAAAGVGAAASGSGPTAVMANSSWTARHVRALWWRPAPPALVHPPCGAADLAALPLCRPPAARADGPGGGGGRPLLVCVAQFRPEKAQALLLRAYAAARAAAAAEPGAPGAAAVLASRLLFFGSVRPGGPDAARVDALRALAGELGLLDGGGGPAPPPPRRAGRGGKRGGSGGTALAADGRAAAAAAAAAADPDTPTAATAADPAALVAAWTRPSAPPVAFIVGAHRAVLRTALGAAAAGLHAMTDEHFGISVVEYMAAGAVPIAHASGGPASDIVLPEAGGATGYLCSTQEQYAAAMAGVLGLSGAARDAMAGRARARAARFSDEAFASKFVAALAPAAVAAGLGPPVGGSGGGGVRRRRARRA